jgi:lipopolysaccharide export system protein LptA
MDATTRALTSIVLFSGIALVGCGSSSKKEVATEKSVEAPKEDPTIRGVQSGRVEILSKDEKLVKIWKVKAESSDLNIREQGSVAGQFQTVTGETFGFNNKTNATEVQNTFQADVADADQKSQKLILRKNVKIESADGKRVLTADSVDWKSKDRALVARGNAIVNSDGITTGPYPVLLLAPDLKKYGTPDLFRNDPTMKLLAATLAGAMLTASPTITDDEGSLFVRYRSGGVTSLTDKQIDFDVTGKPVEAILKKQNLKVYGNRIVGTVKDDNEGTKYLSLADIMGGVRVNLAKTELVSGKKSSRETTVTGSNAKWVGTPKSGELALTGNVILTSALKDSTQWLQVKATRANVTLDLTPGTTDSVKEGILSGPITFQLRSKTSTSGGTEQSEVTGSASKITFVSGMQEILLSGGVNIRRVTIPPTGKKQALNFTADTVRVILDSQGQIKSVMAEGEPGTQETREGN